MQKPNLLVRSDSQATRNSCCTSEEELRDTEERLALALQAAGGGVWDWDLATGDAWWSEEMYDLWGVDPQARMCLKNTLPLVHEQDRKSLEDAVKSAIAEGMNHRSEFRIQHHSRGERWMFSLGRLVRDASGQVARMVGITLDVTDRKRAEAELREALAKAEEGDRLLSALMEYVPEGVAIADSDLKLTKVSRYGREMFGGLPDGRLLDEAMRRWEVRRSDGVTPLPVEDLPLARAIRHGEVVRDAEIVRIEEDGAHLPLVCTAGPIRDGEGRVRGGIVTWRSNAERKQYEEELRRLSHFPEENPNPVLRCDPEGLLLYANASARAWLQTLGWAGEGVLPDQVCQTAEEAYRQNNAVEVEITNNDGQTCSMSAVHPPGSEYVNFYGRDITDRIQAEREREELIGRLEAQNAELERFTYTVSHDLKSPLITIKGYIGMLSEELADAHEEPIQGDLVRIAKAADTMGTLLEDLLELSRIGRLANPPEDVPLDALVDEARRLLRGPIEANGVEVRVASELPVVHGDRVRLLEVVQNLIENAVKYMGNTSCPQVEIGCRPDEEEPVFYVRDNGIGIDARFHEKVFGLFDQLNPRAEGTGIGLAVVKRIIDVHGGRIWVESEGDGKGSTFCFTIPQEAVAETTTSMRVATHAK